MSLAALQGRVGSVSVRSHPRRYVPFRMAYRDEVLTVDRDSLGTISFTIARLVGERPLQRHLASGLSR